MMSSRLGEKIKAEVVVVIAGINFSYFYTRHVKKLFHALRWVVSMLANQSGITKLENITCNHLHSFCLLQLFRNALYAN